MLKYSFVLEPLVLKVGNEYNLNNVKEIEVSEEFLTLDKTIINCQNFESLEECKTRIYLYETMKKCKCLPFTVGETEVLFSVVK